MARFSSFKKIIYFFCSIATLSLFSDGASGANDLDNQMPHEMVCSITMGVMQDPVVAADGYSYERAAIQEWFHHRGRISPRTGLPLDHQNLIENHALQTMIREWKPGRQVIRSPFEDLSSDVIAELIEGEFTHYGHLLHSSRGEHIVAFLGNTGAGKSTLVNLLSGKELRVGAHGRNYVLAHENDDTAMPIGTAADSQTLYPKSIRVGDLLLFDLPGFNDTDGSARNLVNAAFIRQILIEAASVRFVFVASESEFDAVRGASVKTMFSSIKRLFVDDGQGDDLINNSVFVSTKSTSQNEQASIQYLVDITNGENLRDVNSQLRIWQGRIKTGHMYSPTTGRDNTETKSNILALIRAINPAIIIGINVSVLYPPETKRPLIRMFSGVMQRELTRRTMMNLVNTITSYKEELDVYESANFWDEFDNSVCSTVRSVSLLKAFCIDPYNEAKTNFQREYEQRRQGHVQSLIERREQRIIEVGQITRARANDVIRMHSETHGDLPFDFSYHTSFYDQVCGGGSIEMLTTDDREKDVVHRTYAHFISEHSQAQMQRFIDPQIQALTAQHNARIESLTTRFESQITALTTQSSALQNRVTQYAQQIQTLSLQQEHSINELTAGMQRLVNHQHHIPSLQGHVHTNGPLSPDQWFW